MVEWMRSESVGREVALVSAEVCLEAGRCHHFTPCPVWTAVQPWPPGSWSPSGPQPQTTAAMMLWCLSDMVEPSWAFLHGEDPNSASQQGQRPRTGLTFLNHGDRWWTVSATSSGLRRQVWTVELRLPQGSHKPPRHIWLLTCHRRVARVTGAPTAGVSIWGCTERIILITSIKQLLQRSTSVWIKWRKKKNAGFKSKGAFKGLTSSLNSDIQN